MRVCSTPGCPTLIRESGHCTKHARERDKARGSRQDRGYDNTHDAQRKRWAPKVARGGVICWRCGEPIDATGPWDLGHDDHDRTKYRGPEHVACNRSTRTHTTQDEPPPPF